MQFGKRLAEFQMIQKMIAEMAVGLDAAKFLTFRALKMLDEGVPCYKEIVMAKTFASQTAVEAASKAIQIHGAYGYSDELPVERYYRDANCLAMLDKSTELQELEIAKEILGLE
jgi:alkylation response protein AidB-like acyl-CoA dehydrogenase